MIGTSNHSTFIEVLIKLVYFVAGRTPLMWSLLCMVVLAMLKTLTVNQVSLLLRVLHFVIFL